MAVVGTLTTALRAAVVDIGRLLRLESRLVIRSMLMILVALLWFGVLLATAWVGGMVALALLFVQLGLMPAAAAGVVVLLNLALLFFPRRILRRSTPRLGFPVTRATIAAALNRLRGRPAV